FTYNIYLQPIKVSSKFFSDLLTSYYPLPIYLPSITRYPLLAVAINHHLLPPLITYHHPLFAVAITHHLLPPFITYHHPLLAVAINHHLLPPFITYHHPLLAVSITHHLLLAIYYLPH